MGQSCTTANELACAGHAQKVVVYCNPGTMKWDALTGCTGKQLCDTRVGPDQGSCQDPIPDCIGKKPGDKLCQGRTLLQCGPDLLTVTQSDCEFACTAGVCSGACVPGEKKCVLTTPQTCDANGAWQAGTTCGGATTCVTGACSACASGSGDCDNSTTNGCETNTNTSAGNCGACATSCNETNGTASCTAGVCGITCAAGLGNCDGNVANGCETNTNTNTANCGTCATVCNGTNGTATCAASVCGITCTPGFANCDGNAANGCETTGTCSGSLSCNGLAANCGPTSNESCCASALVPAGAYLMGRSTAGTDAYAGGSTNEVPEHTATITGFRLDLYEVTVGRFRKFVDAYPGSKPAVGAGANPSVAGTGWNTGWALAVDQAAFKTGVKCHATHQTWRDTAGTTETLGMSCVTWYEAFAFCAWDGGWLPTEAEWEKAAAGGDENRLYPWGAAAPTSSYAVYDCAGDGSAAGTCAFTDIFAVGSKALGKGRWGQYDLAGGMWEWVFDSYAAAWYGGAGGTCTNCANVTNASDRVLRGGSWVNSTAYLRAAYRYGSAPSYRGDGSGFRCARSAP